MAHAPCAHAPPSHPPAPAEPPPPLSFSRFAQGVPKFDVATGKKQSSPAKTPSYTAVFAETLIDIAATDRSVVAITAAMPGGTGIDKVRAPLLSP